MAHGLDPAVLAKLVLDELAKVDIHDAKVAGRGVKVAWPQITPAGRGDCGMTR